MPTLINKLPTHVWRLREGQEQKCVSVLINCWCCGTWLFTEYSLPNTWYIPSVWQAVLSKKLKFVREVKNRSDVFAVAVVRVGETVGHLPRKISNICSIFLRNKEEIVREVTGSRCHLGSRKFAASFKYFKMDIFTMAHASSYMVYVRTHT